MSAHLRNSWSKKNKDLAKKEEEEPKEKYFSGEELLTIDRLMRIKAFALIFLFLCLCEFFLVFYSKNIHVFE